jgi:hypothetical protein
VVRETAPASKARISAGAKLNLGGSYLLHVELSDTEIEHLFYQTRGPLSRHDIARQFYQAFRDQALDYVVRLFASFQKERCGAGGATTAVLATPQLAAPVTSDAAIKEELLFNLAWLKRTDELGLSVRSDNYLKNGDINYIGDLVQKTEDEMLRSPNLGRKGLNEIKEALAQMGLHLGMDVPGWPPENIDELAKRFEDHY